MKVRHRAAAIGGRAGASVPDRLAGPGRTDAPRPERSHATWGRGAGGRARLERAVARAVNLPVRGRAALDAGPTRARAGQPAVAPGKDRGFQAAATAHATSGRAVPGSPHDPGGRAVRA